jgi:hypothetical protein
MRKDGCDCQHNQLLTFAARNARKKKLPPMPIGGTRFRQLQCITGKQRIAFHKLADT